MSRIWPSTVRRLVRRKTNAGLSDDDVGALRRRVASRYYDHPDVAQVIALAVRGRVRGAVAGGWSRRPLLPPS